MSVVGPTNIPAFLSSDADFRTWGSTISAALATLGLVQTADSGQINWTTVTKPTGISTAAGYEVWRFADSLQASAPVFIKMEYGVGNAVDRPSLWFTVGSATNGAGTLSGQSIARAQISTNTSKTAGATLPMVASGNSGELLLGVNLDYASSSFGLFLGVERPKDATDTPTAEGVFVTWCSPSLSNGLCVLIPTTGSVPTQTPFPAINPGLWSRSGSGANVDICPLFIPLLGNWRFSHVMGTVKGDLAGGGTFATSIFGGNHTYVSLDAAMGTPLSTSQGGAATGMAMRWE